MKIKKLTQRLRRTSFIIFIISCTALRYIQTEKNTKNQEISPVNTTVEANTSLPTLYAVGDSLTAGYQLDITDAYPAQLEKILLSKGYRLRVVNGGKSGETSAAIVAYLERLIGDAKPGDIMILVIGGNDGLRGLSLEDLKKNIMTIIAYAQDKGMNIILGGMQIPPNFGDEYTQKFAQLYPEIAKQSSGTNLYPFFLSGVAANPQLNLPDMIHPNKTGYTIIAEQLAIFLEEKKILPSL